MRSEYARGDCVSHRRTESRRRKRAVAGKLGELCRGRLTLTSTVIRILLRTRSTPVEKYVFATYPNPRHAHPWRTTRGGESRLSDASLSKIRAAACAVSSGDD